MTGALRGLGSSSAPERVPRLTVSATLPGEFSSAPPSVAIVGVASSSSLAGQVAAPAPCPPARPPSPLRTAAWTSGLAAARQPQRSPTAVAPLPLGRAATERQRHHQSFIAAGVELTFLSHAAPACQFCFWCLQALGLPFLFMVPARAPRAHAAPTGWARRPGHRLLLRRRRDVLCSSSPRRARSAVCSGQGLKGSSCVWSFSSLS